MLLISPTRIHPANLLVGVVEKGNWWREIA